MAKREQMFDENLASRELPFAKNLIELGLFGTLVQCANEANLGSSVYNFLDKAKGKNKQRDIVTFLQEYKKTLDKVTDAKEEEKPEIHKRLRTIGEKLTEIAFSE